ncbi:MAG: protein kinase [Bryobacteraceae bacterium]|nr:protein kinase [Bryobacteraceae bacterium]
MTPERFQQVDRIFQDAVECGEAGREAFLAKACAGDAELEAEVRSLLASSAEAAGRIGDALQEAAQTFPSGCTHGEAGSMAGPYLLVRQIGSGGMGTVYQAIRSDGEFFQTVAVKLVHRGMDTRSILQRFRTERQILANLTHPNITVLLDGGTSSEGRPYLVMEYIEGELLLDWCERNQLTIRQRIELFRQICSAVQFAHERKVIHRDLKPGNVMVTPAGLPKLLDFGIAKLLMEELLPDGAAVTETHFRFMTPDYASPEQVRGEPVTEASDIYSLGVMLYELLTGLRPFALTGRSPSGIETVICTGTAPPPSHAVRDPKLSHELAGDLDNITGMAMRKEPERRYRSAMELSEDLARYLEGRPVKAHKDSISYRASKWLRRRRSSVAIAALLMAATAAALPNFFRRPPVSLEAISLCDQARELTRMDARIRRQQGGIPPNLREAVSLYEKATRLDPNYVPAWIGLAETIEFAIDFDQPRWRELASQSLKAAQECIRLDPKNAKAWELIGNIHNREWNFSAAADAFQRALELNALAPYALRNYTTWLGYTGRTDEALELVRQALSHPIAMSNPDPHVISGRSWAILLSHQGALLLRAGRYQEAIESNRQALEIEATYRIANWIAGLALEALGDFTGAEKEFRLALAVAPEDTRPLAALGHLLARIPQRRSEALEIEKQLLDLHDRGRPVLCHAAIVRTGRGDIPGALDLLERSAGNQEGPLPSILVDQRMEPLRPEPRFQALVDRVQPFRR